MSVASELALIGQQRLELIGKHAGVLIQAYINGKLDESALSLLALEKLEAARIIWRPDEHSALCLRPTVNELVATLTQDERKRQIHADVGDHLDHINTRVRSIRAARNKGDYVGSEYHVQLLTERLHDLIGQFSEAIDSLWYRLNSEFGFVSSLDDKIREIELAQKQLRRLLDGFKLIDFTDLIELAGFDSALRRLLVTQLQAKLSDLHGSLLEVQKRLVDLMSRFRKQAERSLLVNRMAAYLKQHPGFIVGDYGNRSKVPQLINIAAPILAAAAPALDRAQDAYLMANIAASVGVKPEQVVKHDEQDNGFELAELHVAQHQQRQIKQDVENYFIQVIEESKSVSALFFLQDQKLEWDSEVWLFQVIAEFDGMPAKDKSSFSCTKIGDAVSAFNHLKIIKDIEVATRFFEPV